MRRSASPRFSIGLRTTNFIGAKTNGTAGIVDRADPTDPSTDDQRPTHRPPLPLPPIRPTRAAPRPTSPCVSGVRNYQASMALALAPCRFTSCQATVSDLAIGVITSASSVKYAAAVSPSRGRKRQPTSVEAVCATSSGKPSRRPCGRSWSSRRGGAGGAPASPAPAPRARAPAPPPAPPQRRARRRRRRCWRRGWSHQRPPAATAAARAAAAAAAPSPRRSRLGERRPKILLGVAARRGCCAATRRRRRRRRRSGSALAAPPSRASPAAGRRRRRRGGGAGSRGWRGWRACAPARGATSAPPRSALDFC